MNTVSSRFAKILHVIIKQHFKTVSTHNEIQYLKSENSYQLKIIPLHKNANFLKITYKITS